MNGPTQLLHALAQLAAQPTVQTVAPAAQTTGLPFMDDLIRGGPYAIIAVLLLVVKALYAELKDERKARITDRDQHDKDKQTLNDRVLGVSRETTTAVLQNTEVQRQLVAAISQVQE